MTDNTKVQIEKLNGTNYQMWKFKIELLLQKEELWNIVSDNLPAVADRTAIWITKDGKARAYIGLTVENDQLVHIRRKETAKEMWQALEQYHQKHTLSSKVGLLRRLLRCDLAEGGDLIQHLNKMDQYMDELISLGDTLPDATIVAVYLASLPESYGTLIMALESRPAADLTAVYVKTKLIDEYQRRSQCNEGPSSSENAFYVRQKEVQCFFCKEKGHYKKQCTKYIAWLKKKNGPEANAVKNTETENEENDAVSLFCFGAHIESIHSNCINDEAESAHECDEPFFVDLTKEIESENKAAMCLAGFNEQPKSIQQDFIVDSGA